MVKFIKPLNEEEMDSAEARKKEVIIISVRKKTPEAMGEFHAAPIRKIFGHRA